MQITVKNIEKRKISSQKVYRKYFLCIERKKFIALLALLQRNVYKMIKYDK